MLPKCSSRTQKIVILTNWYRDSYRSSPLTQLPTMPRGAARLQRPCEIFGGSVRANQARRRARGVMIARTGLRTSRSTRLDPVRSPVPHSGWAPRTSSALRFIIGDESVPAGDATCNRASEYEDWTTRSTSRGRPGRRSG